MKEWEGRKRVAIENVKPQIDCGKYPIKRVVGEGVEVRADIFVDGHDKVGATLLYRRLASPRRKSAKAKWKEIPMVFCENDHWKATFEPEREGWYEYTIRAYVDHYTTWAEGLKKKFDDKQEIGVELLIGAQMMEQAQSGATPTQKKKLEKWQEMLTHPQDEREAISMALGEEVRKIMLQAQEQDLFRIYEKIMLVQVERKKALFSAWYELFPRSTASEQGRHGTFKDCEKLLPRIAEMGFDVIYLPPIHPIGENHRKGKNNAVKAAAGDPGSPWAIGDATGGHKAIHPALGTMKDFKSLVEAARKLNIEIALDFAIQCSPDHPYVKEHPQWFKWRPDGTVQYAENPPKKYQDVLPVNFETEDWENLWRELKNIVDFWIDKGVHIFRVDNPHTKPFTFWEWLIKEVKSKHPEVIFLAEAFTRPRIMEKLAKIGFTQSYTYFTWRNSAEEIRQYMYELTRSDLREYFRPNFWPNTPDILPISLERKPESAFIARLVMAATLSSSYGVYGPIFELGLNEPFPGKEEYTESEKYEVKHWDWEKNTRIREVITAINQIRKDNKALQSTWEVEFCEVDNSQLLSFAKTDAEKQNRLIIVINLDPDHTQTGWVKVPFKFLRMKTDSAFIVNDLLSGNRYNWAAEWNYVELHPSVMPAHVFRIETNEELEIKFT